MQDSTFETIAKSFTQKELPHSELEFSGEVPFEAIEAHRKEALKHLGEHADMPGFRKGHVPENILVSKIGEIAILEEAVEHFIARFYPALILSRNVDAIGRPQVAITKLAPGNPVGLRITTAVFPTFELPDYKKLAKGIAADAPAAVTDEDVTKATDAIRQSRATKKPDSEEMSVPDMTDDFVRTLGEFETVAQFTDKLKEHLKTEKEQAAKEKRRNAIVEAIMDKTTMDVPNVFIVSEQEKMLAQMKDDVKRFGMEFGDYLKRINKTEDNLRTEMAKDAEKRAKLQLVLNAIAEKEAVTVPAEEIEKEAAHILEHFTDADRERVHIYVESVIKNEKVLTLLETA
jgi:trigger factor